MISATTSPDPIKPKRFELGFDTWLLILVAVMIVFGMVMVYSASWDVSWRLYQDRNALFYRQLLNLGVALVVMFVAAWFPLEWLKKLALPLQHESVAVPIFEPLSNP